MTTAEMDEMVVDMVQRIVAGFEPERVVLFGSRGAGRATLESDVDLLVVMPVEGSLRAAASAIDLALADRRLPLDLVVLTPEQFARQREIVGTVAHEAARTGKVMYERAA